MPSHRYQPLINELRRLHATQNRSAWAALRRSRPGAVHRDAYRHLVPHLAVGDADDLAVAASVASLFTLATPLDASGPQTVGSVGRVLGDLRHHQSDPPPAAEDHVPLDRRTAALCGSRTAEQVAVRLRRLTPLLRDAAIGVDWARTANELATWQRDRSRITEQWMSDYWRSARPAPAKSDPGSDDTDPDHIDTPAQGTDIASPDTNDGR